MSSTLDIDEGEPLVFDIGSHTARVGVAGEEEPAVLMHYWQSADLKGKYLENGFKLWDEQNMDIDDLESILEACCSKLSKDVNSQIDQLPALFTEHFYESRKRREDILEIVFEKFGFPHAYVAPSPVLSLYSSGRGCGVVVESGNLATETMVIYEGFMISESINSINYGGAFLSQDISAFLGGGGIGLEDKPEFVIPLKECCGIDQDKESEIELPDGSTVSFSTSQVEECMQAVPQFSPGSQASVGKLIYESIMTADIHCRRDLFVNIILSGGNTLISGFPEELSKNIHKLTDATHENLRFNVIKAPDRIFSPWIGGSILASLSTMNSYWISKGVYEEHGASGLHNKFINPVHDSAILT